MQPRHDDFAQRSGREVPHQPLPLELAGSLEPTARRALMHGMRRRILRTLGNDPAPRTTHELLTLFPGVRLPTVTYHVLVLGDCGSLAVSQVELAPGRFTRSFVSNVAGDPQYVAVLEATERLDDVH